MPFDDGLVTFHVQTQFDQVRPYGQTCRNPLPVMPRQWQLQISVCRLLLVSLRGLRETDES